MSLLVNESCVVCGADEPAVTAPEQQRLMEQLSGWTVIRRPTEQLQKVFLFEDFSSALDFTVAVGELAEGADHHPMIVLEWGKVVVHWWTHTIKGLHRNDFIMAAKTDYLHSN